jgi:hypothetical protein
VLNCAVPANVVEPAYERSPTLAMQLCQPEYDASHIFGVMVTSNGTFSAIQTALLELRSGVLNCAVPANVVEPAYERHVALVQDRMAGR